MINNLRAYARRLIRSVGRYAIENQLVKRKVLSYLSKRPLLKARLRRIVTGSPSDSFILQDNSLDDVYFKATEQVFSQESDVANGHHKNQSLGVNSSQKTPLESYFY